MNITDTTKIICKEDPYCCICTRCPYDDCIHNRPMYCEFYVSEAKKLLDQKVQPLPNSMIENFKAYAKNIVKAHRRYERLNNDKA